MRCWNAISTNLAILMACTNKSDTMRSMAPASRISFVCEFEARRPGTSEYRRITPSSDGVTNGDSIQALVTPTEDVYLYLGYCDGHEFALYPPQGSLRAEARHGTRIPPADGGLEITGNSRSEVVYLILSKSELSLSSSDLAVKIASKGRSVDGDCAGQMHNSAGEPISSQMPIDVRRSGNAIEVERYEFKHPP